MLNWKVIFKILSAIIFIVGISMLPSWFVAFQSDGFLVQEALLRSSLICLLFGGGGYLLFRQSDGTLHLRDGYLVVALSWIVASLFGALPYWLSSDLAHPIDAFFESVAGFTTTGSTIRNVDLMPRGLLFWKATSNWLGGMGILVFAISLLPALGINGQTIVRAEAPGPTFEKMTARVSSSTKILYGTYITFTLLEFCLLYFFTEMDGFDSIINTFGSVSTGGLFAHTKGLAFYDSIYIETVIALFCFLSSVSFLLYFLLLQGKWREVLKNTELRVFILLILGASLLIATNLFLTQTYDTWISGFRHGFFQVVSFLSTSGYVITDFTKWPHMSQTLLFLLLFVGGCASSTSGSMKVIRIIVSFKIVGRMFFKRLHPSGITAIKVGDKSIPAETVSRIASFMMLYFMVYILSLAILSLQNLDMETTMGVAAGCLSNTGLGFGEMGATGNYSMFNPGLRLYLCAMMLMGRLEIFTIFLLFTPTFWRNK
jgi:trk system potassium uptake protein TrkH